ncbi:MAG: glycosyltransferase family 2 protein [Hyphomicrobiales bacterium]|nr:glycosyltransferase family 2 protein [Hyphomicrobiales bacterium]
MPRISIAVPCFNGEQLLAESLADLQRQTFTDFEVIIYNNASTDHTGAIAEDFATRDHRFRVVNRPQTIPLYDHFRTTISETDSDLFMWRADDDLSAPNYIEALLRALDQNPGAVLAAAQIRTNRVNLEKTRIRALPARSANRLVDALHLLKSSHPSWLYGLFRKDAIGRYYPPTLDLWPHNWGVDHATLFPILLSGSIALTDKTYFIQRTGYSADRLGRVRLPYAEQCEIYAGFSTYCKSWIAKSEFNKAEKAILYANLPIYAHRRTFRTRKMLLSRWREFYRNRLIKAPGQ